MSDVAPTRGMTASEYLAWERHQVDKHEFHFGEIFAMAGGSPRHNFLASAIGGELRNALRTSGCRVFSSDQRIGAGGGKRYVYPDAVVVCGAIQLEEGAADVLANPSIVVEVLSPATESYDRGEKWAAYQRIPSLTDYVLVAQDRKRVEHYRRDTGETWQYRELGEGEILSLGDATLAIDAIYDDAFDLAHD
jgi:Uma2 family endonuclease